MATVAEFTIPAEDFPLGSIFDDFPGVTVELERVIPTTNTIIPYFWVRGADETKEKGIEAAFENHPHVKTIRLVDEIEGEHLLRVEWKPEYEGMMKAITETDVTLISAGGSAESWSFEVRSDDRAGIAEFQRYCREHGVSTELTTLRSLAPLESGSEYDLTETQREALVLAYEMGYFDTPREVSLDEIATEFGITRQSVASRLRRGHRRLIRATLIGP